MSREKVDLPSEGAQRVKEVTGEGKIKATLSFIRYVFTPAGRRSIFGSLTHGQNNTDEERKEEYRATELRTSTEL